MTARLHLLASRAWPGLEEEVVDGWLLRAAEGVTQRANSALPVGPSSLPLDERLARVAAWYAARGLPPRVQVHDRGLDAALETRGWAAASPTAVLAGPVPQGPTTARVEASPSSAWLATWDRVDGRAGASVARRLLERVEPATAYASVVVDGRTVAVGRAVAEDGHVGVFSMGVLPEHRRQGLGREVLHALGGWGVSQGATTAYLQVGEGNAVARALYRQAGLVEVAGYRYRSPAVGR